MNAKVNPSLILICILSWVCVATRGVIAQTAPSVTGQFEDHADVGTVLHPGSLKYDPVTRSYVISGSGENMWYHDGCLPLRVEKGLGRHLVDRRRFFHDNHRQRAQEGCAHVSSEPRSGFCLCRSGRASEWNDIATIPRSERREHARGSIQRLCAEAVAHRQAGRCRPAVAGGFQRRIQGVRSLHPGLAAGTVLCWHRGLCPR